MVRMTATERLRRLLAVIPWASGRGEVTLNEIAERFDYPMDRLRRDLTEVVQFVGVYPYSPDMLIEVSFDEAEETVRFELADYFTSPLRLTPDEALSLISSGLALLKASDGKNTPLEAALTKLADRFGLEIGDQIDVNMGTASPELVAEVRRATEDRRCLEMDYFSEHRGAITSRVVEPHRLFSDGGEWYVAGWCRLAQAARTFRLDRIVDLSLVDDDFLGEKSTIASNFTPAQSDLRVTLRVAPEGAWVCEAFPVEYSEPDPTGWSTVTLAVSSSRWLERLLLQLGPKAQLVDSQPTLPKDFLTRAAERVLAKYRN